MRRKKKKKREHDKFVITLTPVKNSFSANSENQTETFPKCWMAFWLLSLLASSRLNLQLCVLYWHLSEAAVSIFHEPSVFSLFFYVSRIGFFSFFLLRVTLLYYQRWKDNSLIDTTVFCEHTNALHHKYCNSCLKQFTHFISLFALD